MKKVVFLSPLIILFFISIIFILMIYKNSHNSIETKLKNNKNVVLPEFSLKELYNQGTTFSKKDLDGHYSIINFFASWCVACKAEHQILIELSKLNYIKIYGIAWNDIAQNTRKYLQDNGNPYSKVAIENDGQISKYLGIKGTPETIVINPKGEVIYYQKGVINEKFIKFILNYSKS